MTLKDPCKPVVSEVIICPALACRGKVNSLIFVIKVIQPDFLKIPTLYLIYKGWGKHRIHFPISTDTGKERDKFSASVMYGTE
jgi:hypothetical protein